MIFVYANNHYPEVADLSDNTNLARLETPLWLVVLQHYLIRSLMLLGALGILGLVGLKMFFCGIASAGIGSYAGIILSSALVTAASMKSWRSERKRLIAYLAGRVPIIQPTNRYRKEVALLAKLLKQQADDVSKIKKGTDPLLQKKPLDTDEIIAKYTTLQTQLEGLITTSALNEARLDLVVVNNLASLLEASEKARLSATEHQQAITEDMNKKESS